MNQLIAETLVTAFVIAVVWFIFSAIVWVCREDSKGWSWYKGKITTSYNAIAFFYNVRNYLPDLLKKIKPKSKIDRDIEKELKKIRKEEKEIKSMQKLERLIKLRKELEIKKEKLFTEVNGTKEHPGPTKAEEKFYFGRDE